MSIRLAFFDGDALLCQGAIICDSSRAMAVIVSETGHRFEIDHRFEEPACPVSISCTKNGEHLYKAAMMVGTHTSDDWESIDLGSIHTLGFMCHVH